VLQQEAAALPLNQGLRLLRSCVSKKVGVNKTDVNQKRCFRKKKHLN
jgi:hypothetical protein